VGGEEDIDGGGWLVLFQFSALYRIKLYRVSHILKYSEIYQ